jgi:malate dehydrogenase (oxaloacetate-decarboxylating)(NADP+)
LALALALLVTLQADAALVPKVGASKAPDSSVAGQANTLIFPNLEASNIAYKLLQQLGKGEVIGPFLLGVRRSANILQRTTTVDAIVNSVVLTSLEAQYLMDRRQKRKS